LFGCRGEALDEGRLTTGQALFAYPAVARRGP